MTNQHALPADLVTGAIAHMNADHADAVLLYARCLAGLDWAEQASLTAIDSLGLELEAAGGTRHGTARIPFDAPVTNAEELRRATVKLARLARMRRSHEE